MIWRRIKSLQVAPCKYIKFRTTPCSKTPDSVWSSTPHNESRTMVDIRGDATHQLDHEHFAAFSLADKFFSGSRSVFLPSFEAMISWHLKTYRLIPGSRSLRELSRAITNPTPPPDLLRIHTYFIRGKLSSRSTTVQQPSSETSQVRFVTVLARVQKRHLN